MKVDQKFKIVNFFLSTCFLNIYNLIGNCTTGPPVPAAQSAEYALTVAKITKNK